MARQKTIYGQLRQQPLVIYTFISLQIVAQNSTYMATYGQVLNQMLVTCQTNYTVSLSISNLSIKSQFPSINYVWHITTSKHLHTFNSYVCTTYIKYFLETANYWPGCYWLSAWTRRTHRCCNRRSALVWVFTSATQCCYSARQCSMRFGHLYWQLQWRFLFCLIVCIR